MPTRSTCTNRFGVIASVIGTVITLVGPSSVIRSVLTMPLRRQLTTPSAG